MTKTANPKIFITGIPTAGKTYLANKIVRTTGGFCLETDTLRDALVKKPEYNKWADFFDKEAEQYGYKIFEDADEAYAEIVKMLKLK